MPIGILGSLAICTVLYILFAHVMTGVTSYTTFLGKDSKDGIAPVSVAIEHMGQADADGVIPARLSLAEPGYCCCYPRRLFLRHIGDADGTKPGFLQYE